MSPALKEKFLEVDGYWIPVKEITHVGNDGVVLEDGRFIKGTS